MTNPTFTSQTAAAVNGGAISPTELATSSGSEESVTTSLQTGVRACSSMVSCSLPAVDGTEHATDKSNATLTNVVGYNIVSNAGTALFGNSLCNVRGEGLNFTNSYANYQGGCAYMGDNVNFLCNNCLFDGCSTGGFSGFATVLISVNFYMTNSIIRNVASVSQAGAMYVQGSEAYFTNVSLSNVYCSGFGTPCSEARVC